MIFAVELERNVTGASIPSIIIGKIRHKKEVCLIILLEVDKAWK